MTTEPVRFTLSSPVPTPPQDQPSILHIFERALRDVSLPIERAREIYDLQREIEADLAEREYIRVRSLVEQELEPVAKDASNPATRSKYATLAAVIQAVRPVYSKHGIIIEFDTGLADAKLGEGWMRVFAFLSHQAGYKRTFHIDMPSDGKGARGNDVMTRTHATGSAFTYGRRYLLLGIFNIAVEDDDGNAAGRSNGNNRGSEMLTFDEMEDIWECAREMYAIRPREVTQEDYTKVWVKKLAQAVGYTELTEVPRNKYADIVAKIKNFRQEATRGTANS